MCFLASLAYSIIIGDSFTSLAQVGKTSESDGYYSQFSFVYCPCIDLQRACALCSTIECDPFAVKFGFIAVVLDEELKRPRPIQSFGPRRNSLHCHFYDDSPFGQVLSQRRKVLR